MRWLIVILVLGSWSGALAQKPGSRAAIRKAKEHYKEAERHFDVGEFEAAIGEYKEAYRLSERPALLFNIAQAYRLAGDAEQALYFYRGYLRDVPDAPNRKDAEELARQMETKVEEQERRERELAELAESRRQNEMVRLRESESDAGSRRNLRLAGLTTAAVGVVALGAGTIVGLSARSDWKEINELSDDRGAWEPKYQSLYNAARGKEKVATATLITGAVVVAGGGLLYWLGRDDSEPDGQVAIAPGLGSLSITGSF